ncbi:hypothetical protein [Streptomyces apocyni]|uniref:hypothetical protein n=1 Tax=Streptomyces apocyni TaxID=2654677 RepID=UPI0012EA7EAA|nr:hypothetical protein [Streptomyces apocyni]
MSDEAYVALLDHAAACTACRTAPDLCPHGQRLANALRSPSAICCRCDRTIKPDEPYERHIHDRGTGAPLVNYSHRDGCTTPAPASHPKRGR